MNRYYDFEEAAKITGLGYTWISKKVTKLGFKVKIGRYGKKYLTESQLDILKPTYFTEETEPTGNTIEIIRITETYHIFESKLNSM